MSAAAVAGPQDLAAARAKYQQAAQLAADDDNDKALALVDDGLKLVAKDLPLLELRGSLLLKTRDYTGALAAYQAYVDAGATGANRRAAQKIVASLSAVRTTFLAITVSNGPASIYLDAKSQGVFCTGDAADGCKKGILPGDYKVIAERDGFERWTGRVEVAANQTAKVAVTLVDKPSALQLHVAPDGATLALDGNALAAAPATVPGGDHELEISRDGFATAKVAIKRTSARRSPSTSRSSRSCRSRSAPPTRRCCSTVHPRWSSTAASRCPRARTRWWRARRSSTTRPSRSRPTAAPTTRSRSRSHRSARCSTSPARPQARRLSSTASGSRPRR